MVKDSKTGDFGNYDFSQKKNQNFEWKTTLSRITGPKAFVCVGELASLLHHWRILKDEFELFVTASGVDCLAQQRTLHLHLAEPV